MPKLVLLTEWEDSASLQEMTTTFILLGVSVDIMQLLEFIQNIFSDYESWNYNLTKAIMRNEPLQTILDIAASKLTNPIALFDLTLTLIHMSGDFKKDYSGTIWEKVLENPCVNLVYYTVEEQEEITRRISEDPSPFIMKPLQAGNHSHITAPLIINSKPYGSIGMVDINEPFTQGQLDIVAYIQELLEYALQNSTEFIKASEDSTYYISRLLSGFTIEEKIVNFHLSKRKWTTHDTYYLLNFSYPVKDDTLATSNYMKQITTQFPYALLCAYENSIIAIVRKADYEVLSREFQKTLELFLQRFRMQCGISTEFYSILDLKYYYIQSKYAYEEGLAADKEKLIYNYTDYYRSHIIHILDNATSLKELCHPKILYLWRSEDPFSQNLVRCLYTYLLYGRNVSDTAKALFIHRNTLTYRLRKIEEHLEMDLSKIDSETLFFLFFSCMLLVMNQD